MNVDSVTVTMLVRLRPRSPVPYDAVQIGDVGIGVEVLLESEPVRVPGIVSLWDAYEVKFVEGSRRGSA